MPVVPYDLCSFAVGDQTEDDIIFTFMASREITLTDANGWVEGNPSEDITATFTVDGVEVTGSSVLIETDGTVTIIFASPLVISAGEVMKIILNADADVATQVRGVAVTFTGTIITDNEDPRYDISFYLEGKIPANRTIAAAIIPRQMHVESTGFQIKKNTEQQTASLVFFIYKNGVQIGSISSSSSGPVSLLMNSSTTNFEEGDILSIFAPGADGELIDNSLADVSITFKGFLGAG
jgi:effector-binding domain-containing protein